MLSFIPSPLWFTLTLVQCVHIALAIKGDSACRHTMCVDATVEGDLVTCGCERRDSTNIL